MWFDSHCHLQFDSVAAGSLERALDAGAYLSFSGIVTFKNADDIRAAAALAPLERILVETDAPFLAPVPHRGAAQRASLRGPGGRRRRRRQGCAGQGGGVRHVG